MDDNSSQQDNAAEQNDASAQADESSVGANPAPDEAGMAAGPSRMFDISSDLNISPAEDAPGEQEAVPKTVPIQINIRPKTADPIKPPPASGAPAAPPAPPQKVFRTYQSDIAEVVSRKNISTASIAIAENKRTSGTASIGTSAAAEDGEPSHAGKKIFLAILGMVLIGGGLGGAYYLYTKSPLAPTALISPAPRPAAAIIPADMHATIDVTGLGPFDVLSRVNSEIAKNQQANSIKEIILTENVQGNQADGKLAAATRIGAQDMLKRMDIGAPDILGRSLTPVWMLGVYSDPNGNKNPFIVLTTDFFQNAFAGMLSWEGTMADDLKLYLPTASATAVQPVVPQLIATASSTIATTTAPIEIVPPISGSYSAIRGHFEDRIVKNKDVRAFRSDNGDIVFLYSFLDNTRLVVAGNEASLAAIAADLEKQAFVR